MSVRSRIFARRESTVSSSLEMAAFTVLNTILNFLRSVIIASKYGAGTSSDAYYATVGLLYTPAGVMSDSLTALVPPRAQEYRKNGQESRYIASYLSVTAGAFLVLSLVFIIFGRAVIGAVLKGFGGGSVEMVHQLVLWSLPAIVFSPLCVVLDNALKSDRYFIYGNSGSLANSLIATGLLFLIARSGVRGIVLATLAGVAINLIVLSAAVISRRILPGSIDLRLGLREAKKALPLFLGSLLGIAAMYVEKYFASFLPEGSMTLLAMSGSLLGTMRGLLVSTFISVYYPFVSEAVIAGDRKRFDGLMQESKRIVFGVFGLGVVGMIALAQPLFMLLFGHGKFIASDVSALAGIFSAGSASVAQVGLSTVATYCFYAKGDTKSPVMINFVSGVAGGILLQALLVSPFGARGLSAAAALAGMATLMLDAAVLEKRHGLKTVTAGEMILGLALLAFSIAAGFIRWSPWFLAAPPLYYLAVSHRAYGLSPSAILRMIRGIKTAS